jgi:hypothetical protein
MKLFLNMNKNRIIEIKEKKDKEKRIKLLYFLLQVYILHCNKMISTIIIHNINES